MNSSKLIELAGWCGVAAILAAYIFINFDIIEISSWEYLFLNVFGSAAIMIDAFKDKNYQPVVLNAIWLFVAIIGIIRAVLG